MNSGDVTVKETRSGGLEIFVSDEETDTLVVLRCFSRHFETANPFTVNVALRGNYAVLPEEPSTARLYREAPVVGGAEYQARKFRAKKRGRAVRLPAIAETQQIESD